MWDGSNLGEIQTESILEAHTVNVSAPSSEENSPRPNYKPATQRPRKQTYWYTTIHNIPQWVMTRPLKNTFPMIFDELKVLFSLPKIGTHVASVKGKSYVLFQLLGQTLREVKPIRDLKLSEAPGKLREDTFFRQMVQYTHCFRMICGITSSFDSSILVRRINNYDLPVSFRENNANFERARISKTTLNRWFDCGELRIDFVVQKMIGVYELEPQDTSERVSILRGKLESTIRRVDKNEIWLASYIMERISKAVEARPWIRDQTAPSIRLQIQDVGFSESVIQQAIEAVKLPQEPAKKARGRPKRH